MRKRPGRIFILCPIQDEGSHKEAQTITVYNKRFKQTFEITTNEPKQNTKQTTTREGNEEYI